MDIRLRKRMRQLPTKQDSHASEKSTPLPDYHSPKHPPVPTNCDGPNHRATDATRVQCNPHNCRSQVFKSCYLSTLYRHDHGTRDCLVIPGSRIPMVRTPLPYDKR